MLVTLVKKKESVLLKTRTDQKLSDWMLCPLKILICQGEMYPWYVAPGGSPACSPTGHLSWPLPRWCCPESYLWTPKALKHWQSESQGWLKSKNRFDLKLSWLSKERWPHLGYVWHSLQSLQKMGKPENGFICAFLRYFTSLERDYSLGMPATFRCSESLN